MYISHSTLIQDDLDKGHFKPGQNHSCTICSKTAEAGALCEELGNVDWNCDRDDPQSYYDWLENEVLKVVDYVVPYKMTTNKITSITLKIQKHSN